MLQVYPCSFLGRCNYLRRFSQVHEIHPSHAFLIVPDKPARSRSEPDLISHLPLDASDEQCKNFEFAYQLMFNELCGYSHDASRGQMCSVCPHNKPFRSAAAYVFPFFSCMLDIVGARFHCAICDSVDICSNCESAGLPGNLDSSDDSHNSSHIMIKV
jgi:hypothetical protein